MYSISILLRYLLINSIVIFLLPQLSSPGSVPPPPVQFSSTSTPSTPSLPRIPSPFTVLNPQDYLPYLQEDYSWASQSIPFFDCSDNNLTTTYYFRWRLYLRHMKETKDPFIPFVITEFTPDVPWAGSNNTIPCASGHHIAEGRWLRSGSSNTGNTTTNLHPIDSYIHWWSSNLPGIKQNYYYWINFAIRERLNIVGNSLSFSYLLRSIIPNITVILDQYMNGNLPANAAYDSLHDCIWNVPGNEGQENSISGPGCRPLVQSLLFGEADALVDLCTFTQNTTCVNEYTLQRQKFQQRILNLWNTNITGFDTWRSSNPPPSPPPPVPTGWELFTNTSIFCCDQSPCVNGHSTFLYEGNLNTDDCIAKCNSIGSNICHYITIDPSGPWCQAAQYCNTTNPFAGGPAYTYTRTNNSSQFYTVDPLPFAQVRELASLSSPWYFNAVPLSNASYYGTGWDTLFDPDGLFGPYGIRTAEARHPQYNCHRASCCWWDGPSWPFETSKVLTAYLRILHDINGFSSQLPSLTNERFFTLLNQYTLMHTNAWLITNGTNPSPANYSVLNNSGLFFNGLGDQWFAEAGCGDDATWTDNPLEGYWYLHSSYIDIVIQSIPGIIPRAGDSSPTVIIHPLQTLDTMYSYWAIDGVNINNHTIAVCWDIQGNRYNVGQGLFVFMDGRVVAQRNTTQGEPIVIAL